METTTINKNSTNKELLEVFGKELFDGQTRVFSIEDTKNSEFKTMYLCQAIDNGSGTVESQHYFLGWNGKRLVRAIHNAATSIADSHNIGNIIPFDIQIEEKLEPAFEGQNSKIYPSSHPASGNPIMHGENNIYEHGTLVPKGQGKIIKLPSLIKEEVVNLSPNGEKVTEKVKDFVNQQ